MFSTQKRNFKKARWRLALVAALTAVALSATLSVPFAGTALASSGQPGEWSGYNPEHVGSNNLYSSDTMSEARDADGNLLQAWRADDNTGAVWMSYNGGNAFQPGSTQTNVAPTVVAYRSNQWMVFYVGTDTRIYYSFLTESGSGVSWSGSWYWIPNQTTTMSVAAVQLGAYNSSVYVVYRSSSGAGGQYYNSIWGTRYSGQAWNSPFVIGGGSTPSAPSATYNPVSQTVYVVAQGTDNNVWLSQNGMDPNTTWWPLDVTTTMSPSIAASSDGNMLVGYVGTNYYPEYRAYNSGGYPIDNFTRDITGWQTLCPIFLSVVGQAIYTVLTGLNSQVYYKEAYSG